MGLGESFRRKFAGTRLQPVVEAVLRARWPRVWQVGRRDHEALMTILPFLLKHDSNCVDVGANRGEMLEIFFRQSPSGSHIAFEPLPHHAQYLRENFPAATVHELAVSDAPGEAKFFHTIGDDAYSGLRKTESGPKITGVREIDVKLARLDDVISPDHRVDFLKIDVEGAELAVLRGARQTLSRNRPTIFFEFQKERAESYGDSPAKFYELLVTELGYSLFRVDGAGPLTLQVLQRAYDEGDCYNFVAKVW